MPADICPLDVPPATTWPAGSGGSAPLTDTLVAQVIQLKDPEDAVPVSVWWHVADAVRVALAASAAPAHLAPALVDRALDATEDAAAVLAAYTDTRSRVSLLRATVTAAGADATGDLRAASADLAELLVTPELVAAGRLAGALGELGRALIRWQFARLDHQLALVEG